MPVRILSAKARSAPTTAGPAVCSAFLFGYDPVTERDFDYRRGWIESLLAYLAGVFAVDVGNFNILSNHLHALLRTRPDLALRWSAEEVAWRWKRAWPELCDGQWVREPTDAELDALLAQPTKIEQLRSRLSSLSWFMARWKEPIAPTSAKQASRVRPPLQRRASDAPFVAMALSEYLRLARTLAERIVLSRSPPSAPPPEAQDHLDDAALHETLSRWGLNAPIWLTKLQQLDRQCTRALGTAERVLRRGGRRRSSGFTV